MSIAAVYGQMGLSYESEGRYKDAMRNYLSAIELFASLRSPRKDLAMKDLLRIKEKIEGETFNVYLAELIEERNVNG